MSNIKNELDVWSITGMCELLAEQPAEISLSPVQAMRMKHVFRLSSHVLQSDYFYIGVNTYGCCLYEDEQQMEGTVVSCAEEVTLKRSLDICWQTMG